MTPEDQAIIDAANAQIAQLEAQIGWSYDQISMAETALTVLLVVTGIFTALLLASLIMKYIRLKRGCGEGKAAMVFGFSTIIVIILIIALLLTLVTIHWQYPNEIAFAQNEIQGLKDLIEALS